MKGRLSPEVAAVLMRAVEAASDALFAERADDDGGRTEPLGTEPDRPEPQHLRADALGLLAERALAAGFGGDHVRIAGGNHAGIAGGDHAPVSGSRAERYQVMLYVEPETLAEHGEFGMSEFQDGTRVSAETARRLACDAGRVDVRRDDRGDEVAVSRRTRTVPPAVRRALDARDRGCRFPGCGLRFADAHHIVHWADGGETTVANMVLLCRRHHRRVHEEGYRVYSGADGQIVFFTPKGKAFGEVPAMRGPAIPEPAMPGPAMAESGEVPGFSPNPFEELLRRNRERGVTANWRSGMPKWKRDSDIPWQIEAAAREAALSKGEPYGPACRINSGGASSECAPSG